MNETAKGKYLMQTPRKKQHRLLLLLMFLLAVALVAAAWLLRPREQSQYDLDANALAGFLPGKTEAEIEEELNRIIEKGNFNISINPAPAVMEDGTIDVRIENIPTNNYWMQVDLYLVDDVGGETLLYRSGIVKQGYYIETAQITSTRPQIGTYNARADFSAIEPDTGETIGQAAATLVVTVPGEEQADD